MIETFKKTVLAGLGAAIITKDKVQEGLDDFVKQGKVTAADAGAMAEKIAAEGRKEFEKASAMLGDKVREVVSSYTDSKHLARIKELEERIAALEHKAKPTAPTKHRPKP
jgi:polyhydroxyalkanoate synthesis regulator phasin